MKLTRPIVILISGTGSNMRAIAQQSERLGWAKRYGAGIAAVISNRSDAAGLAWARDRKIETDIIDHNAFPDRISFDNALMAAIDRHQKPGQESVLVALAGFMRILTPSFVDHYLGRLVNIHPSLLPAFPGLHTHQRAIDAGCRFAGATVHLVTHELDHGPILEQAVVPLLPSDDAKSLAARVLTQEHLIYPRAIEGLLKRALG